MAQPIVQAYSIFAYKQFSKIFGDDGKFNSTLYTAVKLDIELNYNFVTDENQRVAFEKFYTSALECKRLKYSVATGEGRHKMNEFRQRYKKLFNLIKNNTILLQHFGIPLVMSDPKMCDKYEVRPNVKMCSKHLHGYVMSPEDHPPPYNPNNENKRKLGAMEMDLKKIKTSHLSRVPSFEDDVPPLLFYV